MNDTKNLNNKIELLGKIKSYFEEPKYCGALSNGEELTLVMLTEGEIRNIVKSLDYYIYNLNLEYINDRSLS